MNKEERIKYLDTHKEEVEYQIEKTAESCYKLLHDIEPEITMESQRIWAKKWIYKQAEIDDYANCEEEIEGINIKEYIDLIRDDRRKENKIVIYVKDNKIIKHQILTNNKIDTVDIIYNDFAKIVINEAQKCHANKVCIIHNHPCNFNASPSKADINFDETVKEILKNNNIIVIDNGIVTIDDYWSEAQKKDSK